MLPVDRPEHEHANDHLAFVYETETELFEAVVPYVRRGLERGEQILYVVDGRTAEREAVLEALSAGGVDVDDAIATGAISFHTVQETYLRNRPFDPAGMVDFYAEAIDEALEEYEALRVVAGTDWIEEVSLETFMEYEGQVNRLFGEYDATALCLYDRRALPSTVIRDVIRTHPHLIYDGTVCHNFYYSPPDELFGTDEPDHEVDRLLGTLRDRTRAQSQLVRHKRFLRELNEIMADTDRSFEEKLQDLFDLGCEWFDLELGALNRVDIDSDSLTVEYINGDHEYYKPGAEFPLSQTYCVAAADIQDAASVSDPAEEGFEHLAVYREFGVQSYLGTYIPLEDEVDRTFTFIGSEPPDTPFTREDRTYLELMGRWVQYELERQHHEAALERTIDRLEQTNDRLEQFAYAASHDLQEPLRMVSSYLQLLKGRLGEDLGAEAREYIGFAVDGADRMRAMVEDLLAFARIEQHDNEFEAVDCTALLDRVQADLPVRIEGTDAEIVVEPLPTVEAAPEQLEQLFVNLVSNALKYTDGSTPRVEVSARRRDDAWAFVVADNGIGIPAERRDQIFEVFNRLHHEDEYPGTGIGLALCQEIVDNHGGSIEVESEPGEGSTFTVTLPRQASD